MDSRNQNNRYRVVMLPWLAYSHISPYLELAKKMTANNFHIYLCSTPINLHYIKHNLSKQYCQSIELVELNLPSTTDLPPHYHTTNGLPLHLNKTLVTAFEKSSPDFHAILQNLCPRLVIYDYNQWWAAESALVLNIPSVQFLTGGAAGWSVLLHGLIKPSTEQYPFPNINPKHTKKDLSSVSLDELKDAYSFLESMKRSHGIIMIKSTRELEGKYIDYMSQILEKKVLPIGSLIQQSLEEDDHGQNKIFQWLDKKKKSSVVFISFGSECYLSHTEIQDIAYVLEVSDVCFIWVIRFPEGSKTSVEQVLPCGFLERSGNMGMVIEKWAPQAKILSHSSVGGFMSHCGWNSVMESIYYGVPIIAMPMQYDQPCNARLVEEIGVGIEVRREENGRVMREELSEVVRKVMIEESGRDIREKAREISEIMKRKGDEEVDTVVMNNLVKLCVQEN